MSLLAEVLRLLERERVAHALIGAAALSVRGVSRSTADVDLLSVDPRVLRPEIWSELETPARTIQVLVGDSEDPRAGTVRIREGHDIVDVIVGRHLWEREIIEAADPLSVGEVTVPVVRAAGLVLLKLHAGGPRDAWDIHALLDATEDRSGLEAEVERLVSPLPASARRLWSRLRDERRP